MTGPTPALSKLDRFLRRVAPRYSLSDGLTSLGATPDSRSPGEPDAPPAALAGSSSSAQRPLDAASRLWRAVLQDAADGESTADPCSLELTAATLRRLAYCVGAAIELQSGLDPGATPVVWRPTLLRAALAAQIAWRWEPRLAADAIGLSLLPMTGALVMARELGEPYVQLLQQTFAAPGDRQALERQSLEFDHHLASVRLLTLWNAPFSLTQALEQARDLPAGERPASDSSQPPQRLAGCLLAADLASGVLTSGCPEQFERMTQALGRCEGPSLVELEASLPRIARRAALLAEALEAPFAAHPELPAQFEGAKARWRQRRDADSRQLDQILAEARTLAETARQARTATPATAASGTTTAADAAPFAPSLGPTSLGPTNEFAPGAAATIARHLETHVATAFGECRQKRQPISLMLVDLDHPQRLAGNLGGEFASIVRQLSASILETTGHADASLQIDATRWAVALQGFDRREAVDAAKQLMADVRRFSAIGRAGTRSTVSVSVGLASLSVPAPNFPPQELIAAAQRCLQAARTAGGDSLKSIDV